jgi:hypothetical protein
MKIKILNLNTIDVIRLEEHYMFIYFMIVDITNVQPSMMKLAWSPLILKKDSNEKRTIEVGFPT